MQRTHLLAIALLTLAACTTSNGDRDEPTDPDPDSGLSCTKVLDCIDACPTNACVDTCVADGTDKARDLAETLLTCIERHGCADFACVESRCGTELETCDADGRGGGGGGGGGMQGSTLPAALVGAWSNGSAQAPISYAFTSTGLAHKIGGFYTGSGSCDSSYVQEVDAVVQLAGDVLTITPTSASFTSFGCDGVTPTSSGPSNASVERLRFQVGTDSQGMFLVMTDLATNATTTYLRH
jgi:hypothetical protein